MIIGGISGNMRLQGRGLFTGNNALWNNSMKSTKEKLQRQSECNNKIAFLENQKNNLINMEGDSMEDISRKLELFHSYEDQIAAAKKEYNYSQMFHVMDEAEELGEQIAKAAEKYEPKTEEERKKEMVEEALGTDESKGELTEELEELTEELEELTEELVEETAEELSELQEELSPEEMKEQLSEELTEENAVVSSYAEKTDEFKRIYKQVDIRI